jgi:ABC-2 type transport system ATP-binding protein
VLDEPTSGLDPLMQAELRKELKRMAAAGHTVFFSSHTLNEVEALCDRVAVVRNGEIVADEPLEELRARAGHEVMIRWNGAPPAPAAVPEFLRLTRQEGSVWEGTVDGPVAKLVDWLAGRGVADLTVGRPDLESLFRRFYERGSE